MPPKGEVFAHVGSIPNLKRANVGQIVLFAKRDILPLDELLFDYCPNQKKAAKGSAKTRTDKDVECLCQVTTLVSKPFRGEGLPDYPFKTEHLREGSQSQTTSHKP